MPFSKLNWWCAAVAVAVLPILGGCDAPTSSPSLNTQAEIDAPLVAEKTLSFLGGPKSKFDPLIDTTGSTFDSLFTVGSGPKDISIQQEIDNFDVGSLNDAVDEAAGNLSVTSAKFDANLIKGSELVNQSIEAGYTRSNSVYESSDPSSVPVRPFYDEIQYDQDNSTDVIVVNFPAPNTNTDDVLSAPDFGTVDASDATVESVTLTGDTEATINEITFTLTNEGSNELTKEGNNSPPEVRVEGADGNTAQKSFGEVIGPKESGDNSATATVDVSSLRMGNGTKYRFFVAGTSQSNPASVDIDLSAWRYQKATLSNTDKIDIKRLRDTLATAGEGASRFEGIEVKSGDVTLAIDNRFSFPLAVSDIKIQNVGTLPFGSVPPLDVDTSFSSPIESGTRATKTIDMAGRGVLDTVDVAVTASPAADPITVAATDTLQVSNTGDIDIQTMYFRPDGETVQTSGQVTFNNERVTFKPGDYVEMNSLVIDTNELTVGPDATFDTLALTYPDIRRRDLDDDQREYEVDDALQVRFVENPGGKFEFNRDKLRGSSTGFNIPLENTNLRIYPPSNDKLNYEVRGRLEQLEDAPNAKATVSIDDRISGTISIDELSIQKLVVSGAEPFDVTVSPNDGDNQLDISEDSEVRTASFDGFSGITSRVDGLRLANTNLDFTIETKNLTKTKASLYAAIQGKGGSGSTFLAGKPGTNREVEKLPFATQFVEAGNPIKKDSLLRIGVDLTDATLGERIQQPKSINGDNSNVGPFINSLPTEIRFAGQARLNENGGDLKLQKPVKLDAGFTLDVPLQIKDEFVVRDTLKADFSPFEDFTDPDATASISEASFQLDYTNKLPLGIDLKMTVVEGDGTPIQTFAGDSLRIAAAPKVQEGDNRGAAQGASEGTLTLDLGTSRSDLQALADGRAIRLELKMTQKTGPPARLRADDTIQISLRANVKTSVSSGN